MCVQFINYNTNLEPVYYFMYMCVLVFVFVLCISCQVPHLYQPWAEGVTLVIIIIIIIKSMFSEIMNILNNNVGMQCGCFTKVQNIFYCTYILKYPYVVIIFLAPTFIYMLIMIGYQSPYIPYEVKFSMA